MRGMARSILPNCWSTAHRAIGLARDREAEAVSQISERISTELEKEKLVAIYEAQVTQKKKLVDAYTADRAKLVSTGSEKAAQRHTELAGAANQIRAKLRQFADQRQTFLALQDEVKDLRRNQAPEALRQTQAQTHPQRHVRGTVGCVHARLQGAGRRRSRGLHKVGRWQNIRAKGDPTGSWRRKYALLRGRH